MNIITIPIRLISEANTHDHWTKKHKRKKVIQSAIHYYWKNARIRNVRLPVDIYLIRVAPRTFDYDNLVTALKSTRDTISDLLIPGLAPGRADDSPEISFTYGQEKSKSYALRIEIREAPLI